MHQEKLKEMAAELVGLCDMQLTRAVASKITILVEDLMFYAEAIHIQLNTGCEVKVKTKRIRRKVEDMMQTEVVTGVLDAPVVPEPKKRTRRKSIPSAAAPAPVPVHVTHAKPKGILSTLTNTRRG